MKKVLSTLFAIAITSSFSSQVIWNETFETLNLGNLGTDINYSAAGQGGWYTLAPNTAPNYSASNFLIVNSDAAHGKVLQITGPNSTSGAKQVSKPDVASAWSTRATGNNIIQAEFDFFTGPATTSTNQTVFYINSTTGTGANVVFKVLAGFAYKHRTRVPSIYFYMDPCSVFGGTYCGAAYPPSNYTLGFNNSAGQSIVLNNNEWVKVGIAYDYSNGDVYLKLKKNDGTIVLDEIITGGAPSTNVTGATIAVNARSNEATNTEAAVSTFDNIKLSMVTSSTVLGTNEVKGVSVSGLALYPNPTNNVLNIKSDSKVNAIEIYDLSGKKVNAQLEANQVNVSHLTPGNYIITIETEDGKVTEKFIKN